MKNFVSQLNSNEQNALHFIKNEIAEHINPLLIFCWNSQSHYTLQRNCFTTKGEIEEWTFSCNLLVIMPEGLEISKNMHEEISALAISYGTVHVIIHTVDFMSRKIKEHNLFFNWVHRSAILLYERDNALQQLPPALPELEEYRHQADCYYSTNPEMLNYLEEKLDYVAAPFVIPCVVNHNIGEHSIGMLITNNYVEVSNK